MKLITDECEGIAQVETVSALAPKVGRRFDRVELDASDFRKLAALSSDNLHAWLTDWQCGFRPAARAVTTLDDKIDTLLELLDDWAIMSSDDRGLPIARGLGRNADRGYADGRRMVRDWLASLGDTVKTPMNKGSMNVSLKTGDRVEMYHGLFGPGTIEDTGDSWARVRWDSGAVTTGLLSALVKLP